MGEIQVGSDRKQVAIHYWRKDYEIDHWFFSRLPDADRAAIEDGNKTVWACNITTVELDLLEADQYATALRIGFDMELVSRCRWALAEGFELSYTRDS